MKTNSRSLPEKEIVFYYLHTNLRKEGLHSFLLNILRIEPETFWSMIKEKYGV